MQCVSRYQETRKRTSIRETSQQNSCTGSVRIRRSAPGSADSRKIMPLARQMPAVSDSKITAVHDRDSRPLAGTRNAALKTAHNDSMHNATAIGLATHLQHHAPAPQPHSVYSLVRSSVSESPASASMVHAPPALRAESSSIRPRLPLTYGSSSPVRLASPQCPPGRWSARCAESGSTSVPTERVRAEVQAPEAGACVLRPGRARLLDLVWGRRPASAAPPLIYSPIHVPYFLILRLPRAIAPFLMRNLRVVPPASGVYNRRHRNRKTHRREACP